MAIEKYTVFYNIRDAGQQQPANWKEGTVKVKAGAKNHGIINSDSEPGRAIEPSPLLGNEPADCRYVTIEAESRTEAAECIRAFYGLAVVPNTCLAVLSSNLEETKMQV